MREIITHIIHITVGRVITQLREIYFHIYLDKVKEGTYQVFPTPPYISQLADADFKKIDGSYGAIDDINAAKRFGTNDVSKFSYWAWRSCGIVGIQMILRAVGVSSIKESTMNLIEEGLTIGGYNTHTDVGWYHRALILLAERRGVTGLQAKFISPSQIAKFVIEGKYVLASLKSARGGHLILIYGVVIKNGDVLRFMIHDPNNFQSLGESKDISKVSFSKISTRRVMTFTHKGVLCVKSDRV